MRLVNKESSKFFQTAIDIVNIFYQNQKFSEIYYSLENCMKMLEFINQQKEGGISVETAIGILNYASTYAAHKK